MTTSNVPDPRRATMADTRTAAEREAEQKAAAERTDKVADRATADKLAAEKATAEKAVADAKTPGEKAAAEKALERITERVEAQKGRGRVNLAAAGASGDPDVQRLLAQREAHVMNSQPDPSFAARREDAEKAIEEIDDRLAELGYTAG
jgi:hypothetical protein